MSASAASGSGGQLVALSVMSILVAAGLVGSAIPLVMSPMLLFAAGNSRFWFFALWLMPVLMVVGLAGGWIAYALGAAGLVKVALVVTGVPVAVIGALVGYAFF